MKNERDRREIRWRYGIRKGECREMRAGIGHGERGRKKRGGKGEKKEA